MHADAALFWWARPPQARAVEESVAPAIYLKPIADSTSSARPNHSGENIDSILESLIELCPQFISFPTPEQKIAVVEVSDSFHWLRAVLTEACVEHVTRYHSSFFRSYTIALLFYPSVRLKSFFSIVISPFCLFSLSLMPRFFLSSCTLSSRSLPKLKGGLVTLNSYSVHPNAYARMH